MASILKEICIFEAGQHSSQKTTSVPTTTSFHMAANKGISRERPKKDPTCVFCKGMHKPNLCTTITSPKERLTIIKNAGLCFNCLAHHKVSQCASKFTCRECHKKHHTSLCHAFTTTIEPCPPTLPGTDHTVSQKTVTTAAQTVTATHNNETTTLSENTAATTASLSTLSTSVCLLKTAIANVSAGQTTVEGHILFDEGAQRSFITQEIVNQLQLSPTHHENVSVSSFGEQVSTSRRLAVTTVFIQTLNNGHIPISVLNVPKLAAPIHNSIRAHLDKLPYLQILPLRLPKPQQCPFHTSALQYLMKLHYMYSRMPVHKHMVELHTLFKELNRQYSCQRRELHPSSNTPYLDLS